MSEEYLEETPVTNLPATFLTATNRGATPLKTAHDQNAFSSFFSPTRLMEGGEVAGQTWVQDILMTPTLTWGKERTKFYSYMVTSQSFSAEDPVKKTNLDRITLLARKYVAKDGFTNEQNARLAIVTERVRQLLPAVTPDDFERLANVIREIRQIEETDNAIRLKLSDK